LQKYNTIMSPMACTQRPVLVRELSADFDDQKLDQKHPSRAVSFDVDDEVFPVPHIHDFDEHQIDEIWWNLEDFRRFKSNCKQIVRSMNREELDATSSSFSVFLNEEQDICTRGLERFSASQCQVRAVRRFEATEAVLMEQSLQRDEDSYDPEYISTLYQEIAASSQVEANKAARRYQRETSRVSISRKSFFRRRGFTHVKKKSHHPEFETFRGEE
jgi:hypothetical protein